MRSVSSVRWSHLDSCTPCSLSSFRQQQLVPPWTYMWERMSSTSDFYVWPLRKTKVSHSSDAHTWPQTLVSHLTTTQRSVTLQTHTLDIRLLCVTSPQHKGQSLFRHTHLTSDSCASPHHNTKVSHSSHTHTLDLRLLCFTSPQHKVSHSSDTHTWPQTLVFHLTRTQRSVTLQTHILDLRLLCVTSPQHKGQSLFRHTRLTSHSCVSPHHHTMVSHSSDTHSWPQTLVSHLTTKQRSVTLQTYTFDLRLLCLTSSQHKGRSLFRHSHLTSDSCVSPCRKTYYMYCAVLISCTVT